MSKWQFFLEPKTRIIALPNRSIARLYIVSGNFHDVWRRSSFYPAFRWSAKIYRYLLRIKALWLVANTQYLETQGESYLDNFLGDLHLSLKVAGILIARSKTCQKYILQLESGTGNVVNYLKYTNAQFERLDNEYNILTQLPQGLAPLVLKYDNFLNGKALLISAIDGQLLDAVLPPPIDLHTFLQKLYVSQGIPLQDHPWVQKNNAIEDFSINRLLKPLSYRKWSIVIQHGDLTPWNLLTYKGEIRAIDWEYGCLYGFPYLDLIHYFLQVSALVYRWKPYKAFYYVKSYLEVNNHDKLTSEEINSLIKLSVYDFFRRFGCNEQDYLSCWRKKILKF